MIMIIIIIIIITFKDKIYNLLTASQTVERNV